MHRAARSLTDHFPQWQGMRKWGPRRGTQPSPLTPNGFGDQLPLSLMDFGALNRTALEISEQSCGTFPCPGNSPTLRRSMNGAFTATSATAGHRRLPPLSPSPMKNLQQVSVSSAQKMFSSHLSTGWENSLPTSPTEENQGSLMNNHRARRQPGTSPRAKHN